MFKDSKRRFKSSELNESRNIETLEAVNGDTRCEGQNLLHCELLTFHLSCFPLKVVAHLPDNVLQRAVTTKMPHEHTYVRTCAA